jgi:periplasmic glucans biosynthesis protein
MQRRNLLLGAGAMLGPATLAPAPLALAQSPAPAAVDPVPADTTPEAAPAAPFSAEQVTEMARDLSTRPPRPRQADLPARFADLNYDGYRRVNFDADQALWRGDGLPFQMQPHHRGFLFREKVALHEVVDGQVRAIPYQAAQFRFAGVEAPPADADLGFAGFRLLAALNRPDHFDEVCVFLGASYFRAVGRGQAYGISARGLALGTASAAGEEFPAFTAFWVERPGPQARSIRVHALLESENVTGAYLFDIIPGESTMMQVRATLFARRNLARVGIAPGTSMFFFGPQAPGGGLDFRPSVHDSDGLMMRTGQGEQLWRPLTNPRALQGSGFRDTAPQGFGLVQRRRAFADYEDLEARYHLRPDLWVEPLGDWGTGQVHLVEIPTRSEIHDNIYAAWAPQAGLLAGRPAEYHYRLHWRARSEDLSQLRFASTRLGGAGGNARLFVLDTTPLAPLGASAERPPMEPKVETSAGTLRDIVLQPNPETGGLRLTFVLDPGRASLVELRARLTRGDIALSETWLYRWTA